MPECQAHIFAALVQLTRLQSLDLQRLDLHSRTHALAPLQRLTSLRMVSCGLYESDLGPLSALVSLCKLNLWGTPMFSDAEGLCFIGLSRALTQLTSLSLGN
jgi:hypothetical protein